MKRYVILRNFLCREDQVFLAKEVECENTIPCGEKSLRQDLYLPFHNGPIPNNNITSLISPAFHLAAQQYDKGNKIIEEILEPTKGNLTGISLVYGPKGKMTPHCDNPTEFGRKVEWLAMVTVGAAMDFSCGNEIIRLRSGDAIVMDAMAIMHGVEAIITDGKDCTIEGVPEGCRLGVLIWKAVESPEVREKEHSDVSDTEIGGILFPDSSEEDEGE